MWLVGSPRGAVGEELPPTPSVRVAGMRLGTGAGMGIPGWGGSGGEPFISWSMAKSVTHLAAGVAGVDPAAHGLFSSWADDRRSDITVDHLLRMQDGLAWNEEYVEARGSDVIEMLFGAGQADVV